jgi:hypothetical protein
VTRGRLLPTDTRGAIFAEHLVAFVPVLFFFLATWQLIELAAAHLIVQRAASAAARAAVVVLPDDYHFYDDGTKPNTFAGDRRKDIELAAALILSASPHFSSDFTVSVTNATGHQLLTATVKAQFHCFAGWVSLVCGADGKRELSAEGKNAYQGAEYDYDMGDPASIPTELKP